MEIELAGERLEMLPQRALHWAAESTLFIADTHWGKAASFRALSIPVPVGSTTEDLERLDLALERSGAQRLVVLGDLIHARQGRRPETFEAVKRWLDRKPDLELWLVRGNHDRAAGDPPEEWNFRIVDEPHALGPFALRHRPGAHERAVHSLRTYPSETSRARLWGRIDQGAVFPIEQRVAHTPHLQQLRRRGLISRKTGERYFVVAADEVLEAP
ncbi:MAG: metallophosphoesterase [Bryobacterales bacterium]